MPRVITLHSPADHADEVLERLRRIDGIVDIALQRGAAIEPPGDVFTVTASNAAAREMLHRLAPAEASGVHSMVMSEPMSVLSPSHRPQIDRESNEGTIEDVASEMRKDANFELNFFLLMTLSGAIAALGLWSGSVHLVIAAMVIAPGFEPLLRIPFGAISGTHEMIARGALATLGGYAVLVLGAACATALLRGLDVDPEGGLSGRTLVEYWSTVTGVGIGTAIVAGAAGAVVVTAGRAVLTAGVMIALALIPTMALTGMAFAVGDLSTAGRASARWSIDAGAVIVMGAVVFLVKHATLHRRRARG